MHHISEIWRLFSILVCFGFDYVWSAETSLKSSLVQNEIGLGFYDPQTFRPLRFSEPWKGNKWKTSHIKEAKLASRRKKWLLILPAQKAVKVLNDVSKKSRWLLKGFFHYKIFSSKLKIYSSMQKEYSVYLYLKPKSFCFF